MLENSPTWIGLQLDDHLIESMLADGTFSWIYHGRHVERSTTSAFKIAKPANFAQRNQSKFRTGAFAVTEGGIQSVHPHPEEVLLREVDTIVRSFACGYVHTGHYISKNGMSYFRMEHIPEPSLRQSRASGQPISLDFIIDLTVSLAGIESDKFAEHHGDLKPEHILMTWQGARLIDPGYFGSINCEEGGEYDCAITTPSYYPFLRPDDLFAFGVVLWETACRQHPLLPDTDAPAQSAVGDSVRAWVRSYENVGQYFLSPILQLQRPTLIRSEMPVALEAVLLKGLRLQVGANGLIETGPGFEDFVQWKDALQNLAAQNITL